eukprot:12344670-Karenia_brevis.AAC.1
MQSAFATLDMDNLMMLRRIAALLGMSPEDVAIPPSTFVELHSLSAQDYNGQKGQCLGYLPEAGRYKICLENSGLTKLFRPDNIVTLSAKKFQDLHDNDYETEFSSLSEFDALVNASPSVQHGTNLNEFDEFVASNSKNHDARSNSYSKSNCQMLQQLLKVVDRRSADSNHSPTPKSDDFLNLVHPSIWKPPSAPAAPFDKSDEHVLKPNLSNQ